MTTNQASGGVRRSSGRSHANRQKKAWRPAAPPPLLRGRPAARAVIEASPLDRRPGRDPLVVADAVRAPVAALGARGLPELDRVEVAARRVGVVLLARPRLQRLH